ncbi:MAG: hypothetical protein R3293_19695 [Candidatus Promineifilaceae bacterium]|nr:hypothetical protein [Candidatus Promineifilaceae bacterium]
MTIQILPFVPQGIAVNSVQVDIFVDEERIASETLDSRNWINQAEGVYEWVWDTTGRPGEHQLRIVLDGPDQIKIGDENEANNEVLLSVSVRRAGERPLAERDATWVTAETDCCQVHVQTRTAAYRDLPLLLGSVESAIAQAAIRLREEPDEKLDVYFIDRTIGQGGYAGSDIVATYVDRSYAGGNLHELLVHEAVHILDRQFAPQRLKFLAEGLAVWTSGGHYKPEDLNARTAALLQMGQYVPLAELVDNFYGIQHEIGYLEAGGLVTYLVDQYSYEVFRDFYSAASADDASSEWQALNANLQKAYGKSAAQIEAEWLDYLADLPQDPQQIADLETTIRYYDTMRRYQQQYDPSAYFLTAWLPHPQDVREEGNPADLRRHPQSDVHITLEVMFKVTEDAMRMGDYNRANVLLDSVDRILNDNGAFTDPLAANYRAIVNTATNYGYEVQEILLNGHEAEVTATTISGTHLSRLNMERKRGDWIMLSN